MEDRANIHGVTFGTGYSIYKDTILPALESAQSEVVLITCFWARSATRDALNESLLKLSSSALQGSKKIKVRIGFSSCSLFQKLFHTSSPAGRTYQPSEWTKTLGLLSQEDLGGLDLEVKSIFFLPFSVWHPKFVIVDQKRVFLPSCNVSWEDWFEGCVELSGPIVDAFLNFWRDNWANSKEKRASIHSPNSQRERFEGETSPDADIPSQPSVIRLNDVPSMFLPSWHHRNPNFRLPWQHCAPAPKTPLNLELLDLFASAKTTIFLQTPNITSPPVLDALVQALKRGVNVRITTSERLMILEQLVTAGTTTSRCAKHLVKCHQDLLRQIPDEEAGHVKPGRLQISYYEPMVVTKSSISGGIEPVQSHLKLTVVDNNAIVFGSGNMDRASWYTSQELGVAFFSDEVPAKVVDKLQVALEGRLKLFHDSDST